VPLRPWFVERSEKYDRSCEPSPARAGVGEAWSRSATTAKAVTAAATPASGNGHLRLLTPIVCLWSVESEATAPLKDNTVRTSAGSGTVTTLGAGVLNGATLALTHTTVTRNTGFAQGAAGVDQGGGVWNGDALGGGPAHLTLTSSSITHNALKVSRAKIIVHGGGLFTTAPVKRTKTLIAHNVPDQCFGC
jgi:hypothetical protein